MICINDLHLGTRRAAGTTPASSAALAASLQDSFEKFLMENLDDDLIIAGDLFDAFQIDIGEILQCYHTLAMWLDKSGKRLYLQAGNHDAGRRDDMLSSFDFLCQILESRFSTVTTIKRELFSVGNIHMIPHCMNQDLFNIELEKALYVEPGFLILHANCANGFAEHSDASLNVDAEWLTELSKKHTILFAHEHQARTLKLGGKPICIMGNQFPSSIADCLAHGEAQKDGCKYAHVINGDGSITKIKTWERKGSFEQIDWTELTVPTAPFVRVSGSATAAQASDVIGAIARARKESNSFVITNGVVIEGIGDMALDAAVLFDRVSSFNILESLLENLTQAEQVVVKSLLEEAPCS
jgi:DNA repair exonuclease SbcCD nuclease subunit